MADSLSTRARALLEADGKATPGPWGINPAVHAQHEIIAPSENMVICRTPGSLYQKTAPANATFIAAARNDAPDIARAYLEALEIIKAFDAGIQPFKIERALVFDAANRGRAWLERHESEA